MPAVSTFLEYFNGSSLDAGRWPTLFEDGDGTVTITGGQAHFEIASAGEAELATAAEWDITNNWFGIDMVSLSSSPEEFGFQVRIDSANRFQFAIGGSDLSAAYRVAGAETVVDTVTYNATTHRFMRVRHATSGDRIYWEYSSDGSSWTSLGDIARPWAVTALQVRVFLVSGAAAAEMFLNEAGPVPLPIPRSLASLGVG